MQDTMCDMQHIMLPCSMRSVRKRRSDMPSRVCRACGVCAKLGTLGACALRGTVHRHGLHSVPSKAASDAFSAHACHSFRNRQCLPVFAPSICRTSAMRAVRHCPQRSALRSSNTHRRKQIAHRRAPRCRTLRGTRATCLCMLARAASAARDRSHLMRLRAATFHRLLARKREREAKVIRRTSSRRASEGSASSTPATPYLPVGTSAGAVSVTIEGSAAVAQSARADSSEISIATPAASEASIHV